MRYWSQLNPTLRGFLIIAVLALVVVVLNLYIALATLFLVAQVLFMIAIAVFIYRFWRERREQISMWPLHTRLAFYGGALVILLALGVYFFRGATGLDALAFLLVLGLSGFAMWRAWRDQHSYGY